jgi:hypothetical protein
MGWSRDLGVLRVEDVDAAVQTAMSRALGAVSNDDAVRLGAFKGRLASGDALASAELVEMSGLNDLTTPTLDKYEANTIPAACATAKAAIEFMGGEAHVFIGGSSRIEEQPEASVKGRRQTSITVMVTVTTPE